LDDALIDALIVLILVTVLLYVCVILPTKYLGLNDLLESERKEHE